MLGRLKKIAGNAINPEAGGFRFILNVVNSSGKKFSESASNVEFSLALAKKWPKTEEDYRRWCTAEQKNRAKEIQQVNVQSDTVVLNLVANTPEEVGVCLDKAAKLIKDEGGSAHIANSSLVQESLLTEKLVKNGINVNLYSPKVEVL